METYRTWARLFELQRYYSWIVDRFHLSTRSYQMQRPRHGTTTSPGWRSASRPSVSAWSSAPAPRDVRRRARGAPQGLRKARAVRGPRGLHQRAGLVARAGGRVEAPVLEVDVSDSDVGGAVERIAHWLEAGRPDAQDDR